MFGYIILGTIASVFYYIGNHEYYEKGWLLATISVIISFGVDYFLPFAYFGIIGANILFYFSLLIFNLISKRPPGSRSGF